MVKASKEAKSRASKDHPELEQQERRIGFLFIPDGLPTDHGLASNPGESFLQLQKLDPTLEDLLRTADEKSPSFPSITFIVIDGFMSCMEQVANNMKVPRVIFWPLFVPASISQCYADFLVAESYILVNESIRPWSARRGNMSEKDKVMKNVKGLIR